MTEQTFMKLGDKVNRPKFESAKIDVNHPRFKRMVDKYVRWNDDSDYTSASREEYENDIRSCFDGWDLDGYHLAEHLKDKVYLEPDAELVDILDNTLYIKSEMVREITKQWVKENFLVISEDVVGKKVNCKIGYRKYENHYITGIKSETYEVTIAEDNTRKGGYVVGFETVTFID